MQLKHGFPIETFENDDVGRWVMMIAVMLAGLLSSAASTNAQLRVVATTPDLADVARTIGGSLVSVESLAKGTEDIHAVPQRPSFVPKLGRADAVVHLGLSAEHAFLPALLEAAANPALLPGQKGDIDCSVHVKPMDIPTVISRAEGEQHPGGNPHYNTDPRNGKAIAQAIAEGFTRLDPNNAVVYEANRKDFARGLDAKLIAWKQAVAGLKNRKAVSYHKDMVYFADFLGVAVIAEIEPKPGIAPTPRHLEDLVKKMQAENVTLILQETQYSDKTARWLSERTGAKIAVVGTMGAAFKDAGSYVGMIEHNVQAVIEALK